MKIFMGFFDCDKINHILLNAILSFFFIIFKFISDRKIDLRQ